MIQSTALAASDFAAFLKGLDLPDAWALAVSGGADSVGLMVLAAEWARGAGHRPPIVLTVDHGLRPGSEREALRVQSWAHGLGLAHRTLTWIGVKPTSNLQSKARDARYRLIGDFCDAHGIGAVLTGHTLDDQAETVLMRLTRGSGVDGLAAMAREAPWPLGEPVYAGVRLLRPLLAIEHERLRATLRARGQDWIEDPSNDDPRFDRVRVRQALAVLADLGVSAAGLASTAQRLQCARDGLAWAADALWVDIATAHAAGFVHLDGLQLAQTPIELALRVLRRALLSVGGGTRAPRHDRLMRLLQAMTAARLGRGRTLAGCCIVPAGTGFLVMREPRALARRLAAREPRPTISFGQRLVWDNRFELALEPGRHSIDWRAEIAPIDARMWARLERDHGPIASAVLPGIVRTTLPGMWRHGELVAVPFAGVVNFDLLPSSLRETAQFSATFLPRVEWLSR